MNYHFDGFLIATCIDIQTSRVNEPENYSISEIESTLLQYTDTTKDTFDIDDAPHVILIMNESFSDLRVLGNLQLSQENLAFYNSISENAVKGYVNVSTLGGGTANSEFQVFTGCNLGLLPASYYPYQQCIVKETPSLVSSLNNLGYTSYSIHPAPSTNWTRNKVYKYLGFHNSLWIEDFIAPQNLHYGVSDLDTYYKVIELYENRSDNEKMFIFDLTIQNHGGYTNSNVPQTVTAVNAPSEEANVYLSLIQKSDEDLAQLIHYFENESEKVIICMFGDHQPKFSDESFYDMIYSQTDNLTDVDIKMNQYKTPFVIWANYDIPEQSNLDIALHYLGPLLLDTADIPASPFFNYINSVREEYPLSSISGYMDSSQTYHNWQELTPSWKLFQKIQYNYLFDSERVSWGYD